MNAYKNKKTPVGAYFTMIEPFFGSFLFWAFYFMGGKLLKLIKTDLERFRECVFLGKIKRYESSCFSG